MKIGIIILMSIVILLSPNLISAQSDDTNLYRATIEGIETRDKDGKIIGSGETGVPLFIHSAIILNQIPRYSEDSQEYTYYAQIKVAEKEPYVEYVGIYEGKLEGTGTDTAWIMWTPERAGLYYVETYVWDDMEPLTNPGPVSVVLVT